MTLDQEQMILIFLLIVLAGLALAVVVMMFCPRPHTLDTYDTIPNEDDLREVLSQ